MTDQPDDPNPPEGEPAEETAPNYKVGYGSPPLQGRFRKGKSGNPSGRPKKIMRYEDVVLKVGNKVLKGGTPGSPLETTVIEGVLLKTAQKGLEGVQGSASKFADEYRRVAVGLEADDEVSENDREAAARVIHEVLIALKLIDPTEYGLGPDGEW